MNKRMNGRVKEQTRACTIARMYVHTLPLKQDKYASARVCERSYTPVRIIQFYNKRSRVPAYVLMSRKKQTNVTITESESTISIHYKDAPCIHPVH